ncbi:putative F-box domain-containing protein [Helianthus annuus]|uniref:F-box domain-containing protein n=2 Tax=Helianthus annuus TaxID=4232 RepID=A0A251S7B6_HELAN|nr:putative F-box domain-containing protein [Helianthus annuus]KAJ0450606.1 putative F-box domain-containing protein [Helianthus annuus]KAJ0454814.1 putative F-box domain-containing protein [Helianthus annuus]KAJ0472457.1 putative F-box domain-containing protein [Helianthus annuus]KAJ0648058.1 putative F-box domain-containing protein [Helianthus annuus]
MEGHANSTDNDADQIQNCVITDSTNQHNNDDDQNQIPTQNHLEFQVIEPPYSNEGSPSSDSSFLGLDDTFTYDIHNAPDSDSLLYEILSRLPLKSLFRLKCVCKHWQTLISQRSFSRFYISRMITSNTASSSLPFRILYRYICESEPEDVLNRFRSESYNSSGLYLSREEHKAIKFKVLGVSNGLILCCSLGPLVYHVCNPVTRQWVTLAKSTKTQNFFAEGFVSRVNEDNLVTDYTVVRLEMDLSVVRQEMLTSFPDYLHLEIFSSETGEWVGYRVPCPFQIAFPKRGAGPICFKGVLHWFVNDHGMVAFDPYKDPKSCRLIQLPADRDVQSEVTHDGLYRLCDVCQGKLRLFQVAPDASSFYCFSMWDMKDYDKGEWCSEFKVTRSDLSSSDPELESWLMKATFLPLSFHPFDLDVVYLRCVELACLVSYNIQNRQLDVACKPAGAIDDLSWRVVVPFVIPTWPTPVPIPPVKVVIPEVDPLRVFNG